ncbi:MAG: RNA polymerase sigma factor FliA [Burkholderiales bacterium]|nr:RNA polymerase sigma factor FliA [Burkholderiales bacterium]
MYTATGTLDRQDYVTRFAPLVKRLAHHLVARLPAGVQLDDMVQAGMIGLMDAAARYCEGQGAQFETYATQRIRGAMLDELRHNDWLPRSARKAQRRVEATISRLEQRLGRPPIEQEVASELAMSLADYQSLLHEAHGAQLFNYEDFNHDDEEQFLERSVADPRPGAAEVLHDQRLRQALVAAIERLPEREKLLMGLYYEQDLTFRQIAEVLGVTESRVCQLHSQAVARLRGKLKGW